MTEDRVRGAYDRTKGVIKEGAGRIAGDRSTEISGKLDQVKGRLETKVGQTKEALGPKETLHPEAVRGR
jgi:uncharacterized protein YjbJ (UPF0337 family)